MEDPNKALRDVVIFYAVCALICGALSVFAILFVIRYG